MSTEQEYFEANRALWNEKTKHHTKSAFYDMPGFLAGNTSLKEPELALLGEIKGKSILHLHCHFGQDSLSLARMGASWYLLSFTRWYGFLITSLQKWNIPILTLSP